MKETSRLWFVKTHSSWPEVYSQMQAAIHPWGITLPRRGLNDIYVVVVIPCSGVKVSVRLDGGWQHLCTPIFKLNPMLH